ncbi:hypothetical protein GCM10020295_75050 [Streptomyces cinereospinus]
MRTTRRAATALLGAALLAGTPQALAQTGTDATAPARASAADAAYDVLVFSRTAGFRHSSIDDGIAALRELGAAHNFTVDATEDARRLHRRQPRPVRGRRLPVHHGRRPERHPADRLRAVHAGRRRVRRHPRRGRHRVRLAVLRGAGGALFQSHPATQSATVKVEDRAHDATAHLGATWQRTDEWYNYRSNPRSTAHVLASLDESSYSGGTMAGDHPISWCKDYQGGRAFYTGGGHTDESFGEPAFRRHLLGGIRWAADRTQADCRPETGYRPLFDGSSTTGWKQAAPAASPSPTPA